MPTLPAAPQRRFQDYLESLCLALGHADRGEPMRAYVTGLCLPGERKSMEPIAALVGPRHVRAPAHGPFRTKGPTALGMTAGAGTDDVRAPPGVAGTGHGGVTAWRDQL